MGREDRRWQVKVSVSDDRHPVWCATVTRHTQQGDTVRVAYSTGGAASAVKVARDIVRNELARARGRTVAPRTFWDAHQATVEEYSRAMARSTYDPRALEDAHIAWKRLLRAMRDTVLP